MTNYKTLCLIELKMLLETENREEERKAIIQEMNHRLGIANKKGKERDKRNEVLRNRRIYKKR